MARHRVPAIAEELDDLPDLQLAQIAVQVKTIQTFKVQPVFPMCLCLFTAARVRCPAR
jgi:hypothetical protein